MNSQNCTLAFLLILFLQISCSQPGKNTDQSGSADSIVANKPKESEEKIILFFGNSLTAGQGLASQDEAFPALIQQKIDSLELNYRCINAGLSGETSAGGKDRIDWLLKKPVDIFVLELGANDGLRGIQTAVTYKNLSEIVKKVREKYPNCQLMLSGMMIPPNMGEEYAKEFKDIFPRLAKEHNMTLIPFLLDSVAGVAKLNQSDGIHPTAEGNKIMARTVWAKLEPLLKD